MRWLVLLILMCALPAGARTFRFADQQDIATLDPDSVDETFTTNFLANIYEPLVRRGRSLALEPALAESWEQPEPTRWLFHMRPGVRFHEGEAFTADDAVFSIERARSPRSNMLARVASIASARALDPATLELRTTIPDPTLLANLTAVLVMPRGWAEQHGAGEPIDLKASVENYAARHANGTGPFRLASRQPGAETRLSANRDWWDSPAHNIDEVVFTPIGNAATRVAALLSGGVDVAEPVPVQDQRRVASADGVTLMTGPELRTVFLAMDVHRPELLYSSVKGRNPFADVRVRRAFVAAIDVNAIRDRVMQGQSTPTWEIAGPGIVGFDPALNARPPADLDEARRLMAEAGYAAGFDLDMNCPAGRYVNDDAICAAIAARLARIEVRLRVVLQPPALFFGRLAQRDTSFYLLGTTPPTYDSFSTVYGLLMCRTDLLGGRAPTIPNQGAFNHGGFCDERMDALITDAQSQLDPARRQADFSGVWRLMQDEAAVIPLHQQALSWGVRRGVDVVQRPDNVLDFRFVRMP